MATLALAEADINYVDGYISDFIDETLESLSKVQTKRLDECIRAAIHLANPTHWLTSLVRPWLYYLRMALAHPHPPPPPHRASTHRHPTTTAVSLLTQNLRVNDFAAHTG